MSSGWNAPATSGSSVPAGSRGSSLPRRRRCCPLQAPLDDLGAMLGGDLADLGDQLAVPLRDPVLVVAPDLEPHLVPVDREVGMVLLALRREGDLVEEPHRPDEVLEPVPATQSALGLLPALGMLGHGRAQ